MVLFHTPFNIQILSSIIYFLVYLEDTNAYTLIAVDSLYCFGLCKSETTFLFIIIRRLETEIRRPLSDSWSFIEPNYFFMTRDMYCVHCLQRKCSLNVQNGTFKSHSIVNVFDRKITHLF